MDDFSLCLQNSDCHTLILPQQILMERLKYAHADYLLLEDHKSIPDMLKVALLP